MSAFTASAAMCYSYEAFMGTWGAAGSICSRRAKRGLIPRLHPCPGPCCPSPRGTCSSSQARRVKGKSPGNYLFIFHFKNTNHDGREVRKYRKAK